MIENLFHQVDFIFFYFTRFVINYSPQKTILFLIQILERFGY